jgi:ADP-ribosylation factor related protein 1
MYIKIWDVGGQMSLRRLWQSYYKSCHGIVFLVDSTDLGSGEVEGETKEGGKWHGRKRSYFSMPVSEAGEGHGEGEKEGKMPLKSPVTPSTPWTPFTPTLGPPAQGRLEEARMVLESVLGNEEVAGVPILVLANKQDREDCLEVVRIKEGFVRKVFEGEKGGMVRDSRVLPVSALKGTGVKEAVEWVKSRVVWNKEGRPPVMR